MPLKSLRILFAPKEGNTEAQYEDAFAVSPHTDDTVSVTIALADGASAAVFARQWANLLVDAMVPLPSGFPDSDEDFRSQISELGQKWRREVESKAISWHAQEKMTSGSSAALLVVTFDFGKGSFAARSIGDVCLFVVRNDRLRYAFPITKSSAFSDRPSLVSTEMGTGGAPIPSIVRFEGAFEAGDRFLLMTDALAAYFLGQWEAKGKPWHSLPADDPRLAGYLKTRRDDGKLKNDDVTLIDATL